MALYYYFIITPKSASGRICRNEIWNPTSTFRKAALNYSIEVISVYQ